MSLRLLNIIFVIVISGLASSCDREPGWKLRPYTERNSGSSVGEVKLPAELWKRLIEPDKSLSSFGSSSKAATPTPAKGDESAVAKTIVETDLKPLTVYLLEESRGVLGGNNQKIKFGPGGGEIDLRDFVQADRGAFRIVFDFSPELDPEITKRVWYLSNAQKRKVGPDWVGAGCDTYMDISSAVANASKHEGMLIAIGDARHVSALAGTFFFSVKNGSRIEVSRLTVYDSSRRQLHCRGQEG